MREHDKLSEGMIVLRDELLEKDKALRALNSQVVCAEDSIADLEKRYSADVRFYMILDFWIFVVFCFFFFVFLFGQVSFVWCSCKHLGGQICQECNYDQAKIPKKTGER